MIYVIKKNIRTQQLTNLTKIFEERDWFTLIWLTIEEIEELQRKGVLTKDETIQDWTESYLYIVTSDPKVLEFERGILPLLRDMII